MRNVRDGGEDDFHRAIDDDLVLDGDHRDPLAELLATVRDTGVSSCEQYTRIGPLGTPTAR
jgi:hypothetical protein